MINEIKIGDFIQGSYKCGCICGIVTKVKKSIVVIQKCHPHFKEYTLTDRFVNVTKKRIREIGLREGEKIIKP